MIFPPPIFTHPSVGWCNLHCSLSREEKFEAKQQFLCTEVQATRRKFRPRWSEAFFFWHAVGVWFAVWCLSWQINCRGFFPSAYPNDQHENFFSLNWTQHQQNYFAANSRETFAGHYCSSFIVAQNNDDGGKRMKNFL